MPTRYQSIMRHAYYIVHYVAFIRADGPSDTNDGHVRRTVRRTVRAIMQIDLPISFVIMIVYMQKGKIK
jgi:K+-transporting ATPase A subunit